MKIVNVLFFCSFIFVADPYALQAEEQSNVHPYLTETFNVDLGIYFLSRKVHVAIDGPMEGSNDSIDLNQEFGLRRSDETFSADLAWRFGKKWELQTEYFRTSDSRQAELEEDIEWGDVIYEQGSNVLAHHGFSLTRIFFARRFESGERHEFGVGGGFHWLDITASIEGKIIVGDGENEVHSESANVSAPLPNIGVWYMYSISPKWAFDSRLDWMSANVGDYDGRLVNLSIGINYQIFEHSGVGLSYDRFNLDAGVNKSGWRGDVSTTFEGLYAYLSFYW